MIPDLCQVTSASRYLLQGLLSTSSFVFGMIVPEKRYIFLLSISSFSSDLLKKITKKQLLALELPGWFEISTEIGSMESSHMFYN